MFEFLEAIWRMRGERKGGGFVPLGDLGRGPPLPGKCDGKYHGKYHGKYNGKYNGKIKGPCDAPPANLLWVQASRFFGN